MQRGRSGKGKVTATSAKTRERTALVSAGMSARIYWKKLALSSGKQLKQSVRMLIRRDGLIEGRIIVKDGAKMAGEIQFSEAQLSATKTYYFLAGLFVPGEYRQQLIAQSILKEVIKIAQERGVGTLMLEAEESNKEALKLYSKFGFKAYGVPMQHFLNQKEVRVIRMKRESEGPKSPL